MELFTQNSTRITVLYELIKGITVLYMPNQAHNCTAWLIQYSYAVDYYFINYTAHFFALIRPRKVQYVLYKAEQPSQCTCLSYNIVCIVQGRTTLTMCMFIIQYCMYCTRQNNPHNVHVYHTVLYVLCKAEQPSQCSCLTWQYCIKMPPE